MGLQWFKHYNNAAEGQLIGDLISMKEYEAALLVYVSMEMISRFESENERGKASVPIDRIAKIMNMKPSRIDRLLGRISVISRSDLICGMDEEQPRNRSFLMRNWLNLQESRGGKNRAKTEQNSGRSKKGEVRSKKGDTEPHQAEPSDTNFFFNLWNENRGGMPEVKALSTKRKKSCIARLKDNPSQAYWHEVITRMANSNFCCGENNQGWKADFDFLLKPDTHIKVLEGKYDNKLNNAGKKVIGKEKLNFGDDDAA